MSVTNELYWQCKPFLKVYFTQNYNLVFASFYINRDTQYFGTMPIFDLIFFYKIYFSFHFKKIVIHLDRIVNNTQKFGISKRLLKVISYVSQRLTLFDKKYSKN